MKETLLDQFSSSGKNRLDALTIKKKTSVMVRASDGSMQQRLKEIKIPYEVPCVTSGMRFLYYLVELIFWSLPE
ncbi:MAG: hypothetical protein H7259_07640 [Cytophagales bacterium]|nr:hypothetical protein [Cytophaga sp.]